MTSMRMLITGAAGFAGSVTVGRALKAGHEVAAILRDPDKPGRLAGLTREIEIFGADLRDAVAVDSALAAFRPEAVLHLAWAGVANTARNDISQIYDNIEPTVRLLETSARHGVGKFVGLGSQGEYGPINKVLSEEDRPRPTTLYGVSKLATAMICERLAEQLGIAFAWLRLFSTYGPEDSDVWMIPSIIKQLLRGERPRTTLGEQFWDYLYIDDVADGILAATISPQAKGIFNLGSGQPVQVRWIIETVRQMVDAQAEVGFGEIPYRPDQVMHMEADITRLRTLAQFEPKVDFTEGLRRTVAYYKAQSQ